VANFPGVVPAQALLGSHLTYLSGFVLIPLVGTLFTLFLVPTAYSLLAARHSTFEDRLAAERVSEGKAPAAAD
jgi:hypothetical protein